MTENSPTAPAKQTESAKQTDSAKQGDPAKQTDPANQINAANAAPREAYEKRLREINDKVKEYTQRDLMFVRIRTGIFVAALLLGILCIGEAKPVFWNCKS